MPLYEYECQECKKIVEEMKSIKKMDDVPICKRCHKLTKRIISAGVFKITGFSEKNGYSNCNKGA